MTALTLLIYIDKVLGGIIVFFLELISFFKKKKNITESQNLCFENIIIIKFLGIGSISRSLNLINCLHKHYPKAKITFVSFAENKEFIKLIKLLNNYKFVEKRNISQLILSTLKLIYFSFFLKDKTLLIDLESHSNFSKIIAFFTKSDLSLGFYTNKKSSLFDYSFFFNRLDFIEFNYLNFLHYLNIPYIEETNQLNFLRLGDSDKSLEEKINKIKLSKNDKFFVININASDLCIERKWDINDFIHLIQKLLKYNYKIILIGSKKEKINTDIIENKYKNFSNKIYNFAGITSIGELISLFKLYKIVFITNDSGPLHLANIAKSATVSLWGPGDPIHYAENYDNHKILYKKVYCSPCIYVYVEPPCKGNNICMKNIDSEEVFKESLKLINKL